MSEELKKMTLEEISPFLPDGYALVEKDTWIPRQQAEEQIQKLSFDREIDLELTRCGAKSLTAARALLNMQDLRQNPQNMKGAVGRIRKENDWLFQSEPLMESGLSLVPKRTVDTEQMSDAEYYAYKKHMKGN